MRGFYKVKYYAIDLIYMILYIMCMRKEADHKRKEDKRIVPMLLLV